MTKITKTIYIFLILLLSTTLVSSNQSQDSVHLQFDVHPDSDMEHDLIKIELEIVQMDSSLQNAQQEVKEIEESIIETVRKYCQEFIESQFDCMEHLSEDDVYFEAFYRKIQGKQSFEYFKLSQKFQVVILNEGNFGVLVDQLQEINSLKILNVIWEIETDQTDEYLLEKGKEDAISMCHNLGMQFQRISQIDIIEPEEEEEAVPQPQPEEGQEEEEQEEEVPDQPQEIPEISKGYHFQAECFGKYSPKESEQDQ